MIQVHTQACNSIDAHCGILACWKACSNLLMSEAHRDTLGRCIVAAISRRSPPAPSNPHRLHEETVNKQPATRKMRSLAHLLNNELMSSAERAGLTCVQATVQHQASRCAAPTPRSRSHASSMPGLRCKRRALTSATAGAAWRSCSLRQEFAGTQLQSRCSNGCRVHAARWLENRCAQRNARVADSHVRTKVPCDISIARVKLRRKLSL